MYSNIVDSAIKSEQRFEEYRKKIEGYVLRIMNGLNSLTETSSEELALFPLSCKDKKKVIETSFPIHQCLEKEDFGLYSFGIKIIYPNIYGSYEVIKLSPGIRYDFDEDLIQFFPNYNQDYKIEMKSKIKNEDIQTIADMMEKSIITQCEDKFSKWHSN